MTAITSSAGADGKGQAGFKALSGRIDQFRGRRHEKRSATRFAFEEPVILETERGEMIGAVVFNHGRSGLYFESNFKACQGAVLIIRNESALSTPCHRGCTARVQWTRAIKLPGGEFSFGTGVKYC